MFCKSFQRSPKTQILCFNNNIPEPKLLMMSRIRIDPGSDLADEKFAIIYSPGRGRGRFPETCVETVASAAEAIAGLDPDANRYPAKVVGPCRSSEGFKLYYLIDWLRD